MNIILVLASCCFLVGAATAQTWIAGTPVTKTTSRGGRALRAAPTVCTAKFQAYCEDDVKCNAKSVIFCTGDKKGSVAQCEEGEFCVETVPGEAECLSTPPVGCAGGSDFECTSEGFFPDPSDCYKYYQCFAGEDNEILSRLFLCPKPYVFDPSGPNNKYCRLTNGNAAYCSRADCSSYKSPKHILMKFSWFPASMGQYVVTCAAEKPQLVTKCPAGLNANLAGREPKCELVCTRAAVAAHPTDVTLYFECIYNDITRRWESKEQPCFTNYFFDAKLKTCVEAPSCTNGANNPPKCNACSGNKAFEDGSCKDCETEIVNESKDGCEACPTNAAYDKAFKGCACTDGTKAINTVADPPVCAACPSGAPINTSAKKCICTNNAIDPFASTPCSKCADGSAPAGSAVCPLTS